MNSFKERFILDFIEKERWRFITDGLKVTLIVTVLAVIFGIIIGVILAMIRCLHDQCELDRLKPLPRNILKVLNALAKAYITIIRGTPVLVQLLIMYFIIMVTNDSKLVVAVTTFAINSGAYVAEIFRGGIMALDKGQIEAGRSLGFTYLQTYNVVVLPQAIKSVTPALCNELIALLKETSICGYIGLNELTRGGDIIRGTTFDALLPLFTVALIYLVLVLGLSAIFARWERRLRTSDNR
ncbi:MAG: amino acid ABC transporter permease [Pseudobutyrivibrio sp.]|mgnify:FL=1|nr:amino acid ABC transporter permease [Pseudobutyrivibrio sp.]